MCAFMYACVRVHAGEPEYCGTTSPLTAQTERQDPQSASQRDCAATAAAPASAGRGWVQRTGIGAEAHTVRAMDGC